MTCWEKAFDVRVAAVVVFLWTIAAFILVASFGFENSKFFRFGPGDTVHFFGNPVDTYAKYCGIIFYVTVQQLVQTYGLNTITPWLLNEVQNLNVNRLEQSDSIVLTVTTAWYCYLWFSRIISIQILLSQIDFLLLILVVELLMTGITTKMYFLEKKKQERIALLDEKQGTKGRENVQEGGFPWALPPESNVSVPSVPKMYVPTGRERRESDKK